MLRTILRTILSPWVFLIALGTLIVLIGGIFLFVNPSTEYTVSGAPTAIILLIPAPSPTLQFTHDSEEVNLTQIPEDQSEGISIGSIVQITRTEGSGLNLRGEPGLESTINFVGLDSEIFEINDGPVEIDGYIWYHLTGFYNDTRKGWAVTDFIEVIQNP